MKSRASTAAATALLADNDHHVKPSKAKLRLASTGLRVRGKPPELSWIPIADLRIDDRYQRKLKEPKVIRLAADWDWISAGAIMVALRGDGEWYVIDGGHRVEAARRRGDISELPCLLFEVDTIEEEASGFLSSNAGRAPMEIANRFKAQIVSRDLIALKLEGLIDGSGRVISTSTGPHSIACLAIMLKQMAANERPLRRVWPLILSMYEGAPITDRIIGAFCWLEASLPAGVSLTDAHWYKRCRATSITSIDKEIMESVLYRKKGGDKSWGLGLLKAINSGLRNKLNIRPERLAD
jgi:hypothetical protein